MSINSLISAPYVTSRPVYVGQLDKIIDPFLEGMTDAERAYDPEYSWNYEIGTRLKFLNGRLTAEADLFYIDWRHMQTTYTIPAVGNLIANAGHTNSKGFELSFAYHPIKLPTAGIV